MKVKIIAEAGVNHNGDINLAYRLVDVAKASGADIVKFQTFSPIDEVSKFAKKAEYQKGENDSGENQLEMLKKLALSHDDFIKIKAYCEKVGIEFLSTPFDLGSIDFLESLGCKHWKIPSGEITNYPYLVKISKTALPIIMSTGMSNIDEIEEAISLMKSHNCGEITLLHCTTEYPAPIDEINLNAIKTLKNRFKTKVGYSDHSLGIESSIAAVALGAEIIEKHFTLDKKSPGPDHKASLEPSELKAMVTAIRKIELAMGTGEKVPTKSEIKNIEIARKSLVAKCSIKAGEIFSIDNLTTKRPGNGISPMLWAKVIGTAAKRNFEEDELIEI